MSDPDAPELATLLVRHQDVLTRIVAKEASGLIPFEPCEDLVQGICAQALKVADRFQYQGEEHFLGWLIGVVRQHLADRHRYWSSLKRRSARVLRLSAMGLGGTEGAGGERAPFASVTGPSTFAARREQVALAARALALLSERDRRLVVWLSEDVALDEQARRLELSADSTRRASLRALERFRKTFRLIAGEGPQA